jgi:uncharacterized membrane protein YfcA
MTISLIVIIFLGGLLVGLLTGLLGIGGGAVMVPLLYQIFLYLDIPSKPAFTSAVATSLLVIIVGAASASRIHYKNKLLDMPILFYLAIGSFIGAIVGSHIMVASDDRVIRFAFGIFFWILAAAMFLPKPKPHPDTNKIVLKPFQYIILFLLGCFTGLVSSLFGIGGGIIVTVALTFFGVSIHRAIANVTALIVVTALIGSSSYISMTADTSAFSNHMWGWVHPLAAFSLMAGTLLTARRGVELGARYSRSKLRNILVLFQIVMGVRFIFF